MASTLNSSDCATKSDAAPKEPSKSNATRNQRFVYILLLEPEYKWEGRDSTHCVVQGVYSSRAAAVEAAGQVYPYSYIFPDNRTFDELIAKECKNSHVDLRNDPHHPRRDDDIELLLEIREPNRGVCDSVYVKKFPIED